jgi:hypothetical protein
MIEIAEELTETMNGREIFVAVSEMVLPKLAGRITQGLERLCDGDIACPQPERPGYRLSKDPVKVRPRTNKKTIGLPPRLPVQMGRVLPVVSRSVHRPGAESNATDKCGNETSLRYSVIDGLRLSVGALTDYFNLHDLPGLGARNGLNVSGLITEVRWNIFNRLTSPFGMTLTVNPEWRRTDPASGRYNDNFAVTAALLIDKEVIADKLFMVLNLVYSPTFLPLNDRWLRDDSFTVLVGGSYVITPDVLIGAEIRHENLAPNLSPNAHALYVGPHMFLQLAESLTASFAWAFQIPDLGAHHADLANFERYEAGLRVVYSF